MTNFPPHTSAQNHTGRGRPTVLDPVKQITVCALVGAGLSQREAAEYVDCSPAAITRLAQSDPLFASRLRFARAKAEASGVRRLMLAGARSWRASAWFLERRYPERYGPATTNHRYRRPRRAK